MARQSRDGIRGIVYRNIASAAPLTGNASNSFGVSVAPTGVKTKYIVDMKRCLIEIGQVKEPERWLW